MTDSIIFLRHGQAENNTKAILSGRTKGVKLTEEGIKQAHATAQLLEGREISHIYSSPVQRAHDTARILSEHVDAEVTVDERLTELDMGTFTGSKYDEIMNKHGNVFLKFYQNDPEIPKYGVETFDQLQKRVIDMINFARKKHPSKSAVLVTHMDPIKVALAHVMSLSPESIHDFVVANASLTVLGADEYNMWVRAINLMPVWRFESEF